jgi:mannosyltransferase OCH1-like enzyme
MTDSNVKIPKIIHQTCKDKNKIPEAWKSSPESFKTMMSDWEYRLTDDTDNRSFIVENYPEYLELYDNFEYPIMRVDFWRLAVLHKMGGLYCDADYEVTKPLDELFTIDREFYVVPSGNFAEFYTNSIIAAKPGAEVLRVAMEMAKEDYPWYAYGKHFKVMTKTGPLMFTRAVATQSEDRYHILNSKLLTPCSVCDPKPCRVEGGYLTTLEGSSWTSFDSKCYNVLKCRWRSIAVLIMIIVLVIFVILLLRAFREPRKHRIAKK